MDPDVCYNIIFKGLRSKASFSNGDVVRLKDQNLITLQGKSFLYFPSTTLRGPPRWCGGLILGSEGFIMRA